MKLDTELTLFEVLNQFTVYQALSHGAGGTSTAHLLMASGLCCRSLPHIFSEELILVAGCWCVSGEDMAAAMLLLLLLLLPAAALAGHLERRNDDTPIHSPKILPAAGPLGVMYFF